MSLSQLVKEFEDHSERKLFEIHMAASVAELNLLKIKVVGDNDSNKALEAALSDIRYIKDKLTNNNYRTKPETGEF
jgi:hypothetical protein